MGLFRFVKDAGSLIFNKSGLEGSFKPVQDQLRDAGIDPTTLQLQYEGTRVTVSGTQPTQALKEKAVLVLGNIRDVDEVVDRIAVRATAPATQPAHPTPVPAPEADPGDESVSAATSGGDATPADWESDTYTVKSGDTLSGIAKKVYGSASKYRQIFEANKPMLKDPDKIFPGQVLRIPPDAD